MSETKPQPRVIVFSTPTCSFCNMAKKYFREKGIKFSDVDVSRDPAAARLDNFPSKPTCSFRSPAIRLKVLGDPAISWEIPYFRRAPTSSPALRQ